VEASKVTNLFGEEARSYFPQKIVNYQQHLPNIFNISTHNREEAKLKILITVISQRKDKKHFQRPL
jgi:hypothetical protein